MHFDFATALVLAALVTGGVWALDAVVLAGRREAAAHHSHSEQPILEHPPS